MKNFKAQTPKSKRLSTRNTKNSTITKTTLKNRNQYESTNTPIPSPTLALLEKNNTDEGSKYTPKEKEDLKELTKILCGELKSNIEKFKIRSNELKQEIIAEKNLILTKNKDAEKLYLLIDSKSLPRSGLHYIKNTLFEILGEKFSFCEWYHEVGCCKHSPCRLDCYKNYSKINNEPRIRLIKSHDYYLTDTHHQSDKNTETLILIRDPLYVLTSLFALDQIESHKEALSRNGINTKKIWLNHEKEVEHEAYRIIDKSFTPPTSEELNKWLEIKIGYISGFLKKWATLPKQNDSPKHFIIKYDEANEYIKFIIERFLPYFDDYTKLKFINYKENRMNTFKPRPDPFTLESKSITEFLMNNNEIFTSSANKISKNHPPLNFTNFQDQPK